jgi:F0F1-type ATP synthase gamma subunit
MDNEAILKINLEDLPDDQKTHIEQATEEVREKCLLSYSRMRNLVIQKTPLPSVLPHGQSEDVEARTTAHLVHKTIHEAFTNHNKVLTNIIDNVVTEVFFGAPVD